MRDNDLFYYRSYGVFDNPHEQSHLFCALASSPEGIASQIQQCCVHPWDFVIAKKTIPLDRGHERHLRRVPAMLEAMVRLENKGLHEARGLHARLMVSCRSYALLIMSILKRQGVPSRCRYGFNALLFEHFCHDQVMVEYWDMDESKWCRLDPRTSRATINHLGIHQLNPAKLPTTILPLAAEAWLACRSDRMPWTHFGSGLNKSRYGMRVLRDAMIQDLAMVNQIEPLMWDQWGAMLNPMDNTQLARFDELAEILSWGDRSTWIEWYQQDAFRYPDAWLVED